MTNDDSTPNEKLRKLVDKWRHKIAENGPYYHQSDVPVLLDELEAVIENE